MVAQAVERVSEKDEVAGARPAHGTVIYAGRNNFFKIKRPSNVRFQRNLYVAGVVQG